MGMHKQKKLKFRTLWDSTQSLPLILDHQLQGKLCKIALHHSTLSLPLILDHQLQGKLCKIALHREIVPPRETVAIARVAIAIVGRGG